MKFRNLALIAFALASTILTVIAIPSHPTILDGIREKAASIMDKRMLCWDSAIGMKSYLDSAGLENSIVTCEVNICQNTEPDKVFYSVERKEMGYFHNGSWYSENDCIRGHVVNSFVLGGETLYIDSTRSSQPARNSSVVLACFRY